ncbi:MULTISPECIES: proline--tRNA ligase [Dictyoglomus]|uniref:Proline--tRNA ligase n=1 Tax=Dictyoglomus turgidum (strain DSM 6724 / Z-1310) TaxID=515635 RepID=B8E028_DICTD|nr:MULTISPECIES: proline--tRNA ligase [Dictyoglomus]ACK42111.1 prolyl-tRNA synthetase [Dictyoglomus turgidum DSM 6724]HBU32342.1 proline--tRNA ligase [Dictyoglomus sp.]
MEKKFVEELTSQKEDFSKWYTEVVLKADLVDYSPVKGCMVIKPYGYAIWENMQRILDEKIKETGHVNAYFPLFIPKSFLEKEAEHVEGFSPQVAWVTKGGDEDLFEPLAVRPTSEAIICSMYSKWIQSWRDLPILINQWANVVRWEKETRPFLRTTEFLWQEGHTAHRTFEEAEEEALRMLNVYKEFVENDLAIPVIAGKKTENEKFAGALHTYSIEVLLADGRALQAGTSHNLGQHFAKAFDIMFQDVDGERKYVWQTSWGVSTRLIGALIMTHGDDYGLVLPPRVAPYQIVIIPIWKNETDKVKVYNYIDEIYEVLKKYFRVKVDRDEEHTPGWKFNEWELKGVPVRLEIGPKEVEKQEIYVARRDLRTKISIRRENMIQDLENLLKDIQKTLFERALKFREENTYEINNFEEFKKIMDTKRGFVKASWCGDGECELKIKELTGATIRNIPLDWKEEEGKCILCGRETKIKALFAKAY